MESPIVKNVWRNAYYFWISEKGSPMKVKPVRYIGLKGWNNYIYKKEYEGVIYSGEQWTCEDIFGDEHECIFRIVYSEDMEDEKYKQKFRFTYNYIGDQLTEINAHTDGYDSYITGDVKLRKSFLIDAVNERHRSKIKLLKKYFKTLNNHEHRTLKLGIQLYLRRLETPTMATSREWKEYGENHPYMRSQIIEIIYEKTNHHN